MGRNNFNKACPSGNHMIEQSVEEMTEKELDKQQHFEDTMDDRRDLKDDC